MAARRTPRVGFVDPACPLDWSHPLSPGLYARYGILPSPGWSGGLTVRNLVRGKRNPVDGTLNNMAFPSTATSGWGGPRGRPGGYGSIACDGTDDYFATVFPGVSTTQDHALAFWFRPTWLSAFTAFPDNLGRRYTIFWTNGDIEDSFGNSILGDTGSTVGATSGKWWHFCVSRVAGTVYRWLNGKLVNSQSNAKDITAPETSQFGNNPSGGGSPYTGLFDDVCVWVGRGLSTAEVVAHFQETERGSPEWLRWVGRRTYFGPASGGGGGTAYTFTPSGGLVGGGTSAPVTAYTNAPSGGLVAGGLAGIVAAYHPAPSGGLVGGGASSPTTSFTNTPSGGLVAGGTSTPATAYTDAPAGGLIAGGTSPAVAAYTSTPSGGLIGGGTADVATSGSSTYTPSGGLIGGGSATTATAFHAAPSGGLTGGGTATFAYQLAFAPGGGGVLGGAVAFALSYGPTPAGGLVGGGSAGVAWSATYLPSGGLVGGGSVTVIYHPLVGTVVYPGGVTRRPGNLTRISRRPGNLTRVTRPPMPNTTIEYESWEKAAAEVRRRVFDWTKFPEVAAGDTIASVDVPAVAGITATPDSSPPSADDFEGPAVGKYWGVTFSGGVAGADYLVKVNGTTAGGSVLPIWLNVQVR